MKKLLFIIGIVGGLGVIIGAFGAHALVPKISPESLASYKTGVLYHFIHTLAAVASVILFRMTNQKLFKSSTIFFLFGVLFFSGSLYLLTTRAVTHFSVSWLGPVTPIGGVLFIIGWFLLSLGALRIDKSTQ